MSDIIYESNQLQPFAPPSKPTAILILEDNSCFYGTGFGAEKTNVGEVCFNTSMTGYQEIITDPSYAGQIITFTFPHIGNTGTNRVDIEADHPVALGIIIRNEITAPSNWRHDNHLHAWLCAHDLPGISGIDTRALTRHIRDHGPKKGVLCHAADGQFDCDALAQMVASWPGLIGMDLASKVSTDTPFDWSSSIFDLARNGPDISADMGTSQKKTPPKDQAKSPGKHHVIAMDFGCKQNILRCLVDAGCRVQVVPATMTAEQILTMNPDGIFLANGPGDPAATGEFAVPEIKKLIDSGLPIFGICIGHQLLALAFGAKTCKMERGHRGANHPVKDLTTGHTEITSQNHGFVVEAGSLPDDIDITHISLFDQSIEGLRHKEKPVFSVQYHPESSPGPHDSRHLFKTFTTLIEGQKAAKKTGQKRDQQN